jgi:hypothetical protein
LRSWLRRSGAVRCSGRSGLLRSGSCGLLRSFELLQQRLRQPRLRRRYVRLVQEAVQQGPWLRTLVLLRSGPQLLRSGSELLRSGCGDLRCSVRCLQLSADSTRSAGLTSDPGSQDGTCPT